MEVESKEKRENRKKIFSKSDFLCFNYYTIASRANRRVTSRLSGALSKKMANREIFMFTVEAFRRM